MRCEEAVVWLCPPYSLSPSLSTNHGRCCFDIPGLCLAPLEYRTITGLAFKAWLRPHPSPGAWLICPRAGAGLHPHSSDFHRRLRLSVLSLEFILDQAIRRAEAQVPYTGSCPGSAPLAARGSLEETLPRLVQATAIRTHSAQASEAAGVSF